MLLRKWNYEKHTYTPYEISDNKELNIKLNELKNDILDRKH